MAVNWYYVFSIAVIACGGIPKGYDEGGYSASLTLPSFEKDFNLETSAWKSNPSGLANRKANITSFGVLGAAFGALIALYINDRIGRLWSWRAAIILWASGDLMQVFASGHYGFLLFARVWMGLGAGALTAVSPMFLSEIAGARARGMVVSSYMTMLLLWFAVGFFVNYGTELHISDSSRLQYRLVQALPLLPTGLGWLASFFLTESPRWLAAKGKLSTAQEVLARLRGLPVDDSAILDELEQIQEQVHTKAADLKQNGSLASIIKDTFTVPSYRSRILLAWTMQAVAQWSGGQGISYYMPQIFTYAGISSSSQSLVSSGAYGVVKLAVTVLFAVCLIDALGRRPCFLVGLSMELVAHIYLAAYLAVDPTNNKNASNAAIAAIFIYAIGWSVGLCTIEFIYATEIFPTRTRSFAYGSTVGLHWFFQFAVVRVTPLMFESLDVYGTFVFFACICVIGIVVLGLWAPETKQVPLERMGELFEREWYTCWRAKAVDGADCERAREHSWQTIATVGKKDGTAYEEQADAPSERTG